MLARLQLLQLLSPQLPIGSYSYSQGLEWAVAEGWIEEASTLRSWLEELIRGPLAQQDLPLLKVLYQTADNADKEAFDYWSQRALAFRDTAELRLEERARAEAYLRVFAALPLPSHSDFTTALSRTPLACVAWAAAQWKIDPADLLPAWAHNWLESSVINGVKIIPLGQSQGQQLLHSLLPAVSEAVEIAQCLDVECIGFSTPALSAASCRHELQHTRIFRS
ncbi:MAG: urease accessory protein UreF [Gammaproteobacteria bacterium]|nr:urease accessory protein UreF [Gammaproteobacteria bacterium]